MQSETIETLERSGYLDDARFARDRAVHLAERGYGNDWIRADLEAQGVDRDTVAAAVAMLEPELSRAAREAAKARGGVRAARSLARRGFSEETIESVLVGAVAEDPPEGVG